LGRVVKLFLDSAPEQIAAMRAVVRAADASGLGETAHALKSASANLGAIVFAESCQQLETVGWEGRLDEAMAVVAVLEQSLPRVRQALTTLSEVGAG
jgi:HPt (histidine-containing phosphotransfer) domain-containing protein